MTKPGTNEDVILLRLKKMDSKLEDTLAEVIVLKEENKELRNIISNLQTTAEDIKKSGSAVEELRKEIESCKTGMEFMNAEFENTKKNLELASQESMLKGHEKFESTMRFLNKKISDLERTNDNLEQQSRNNNLEFHGVPHSEKENLPETIMKIANALKAEITTPQIVQCYRVRFKNKDKTGPVIAKFSSVQPKKEFLKVKKAKRDIKDFGVDGMEQLFLNENLTNYRRDVFFEARAAKQKKSFKYLWTANGNIYMKKNDGAPRIHIESKDDLDKLK